MSLRKVGNKGNGASSGSGNRARLKQCGVHGEWEGGTQERPPGRRQPTRLLAASSAEPPLLAPESF